MYNGSATNNGQTIASYTNINNLEGNTATSNTLNLTALSPIQPGKLVINGLSVSLADPLTWSGYTVIPPSTASSPTTSTTTSDIPDGVDIASIIQQGHSPVIAMERMTIRLLQHFQ